MDCLEGMRQMDDKSVDLVITSPPYNKAGLNGKQKRTKNCHWEKTFDYNNNVDVDNMPEDEYEKWQVDVLNECFRVLKDDGSLFYNHKMRFHKNRAIFPMEWISKSNFILRQMLIWNKGGGYNMDRCRYYPCCEYIFWLVKEAKRPRFTRQVDTPFPSEVWNFGARRETEHPAPFPIKIPDNIIPSVAQGERILVMDPFMGSGTVALSAIKNHCDYIGFEKFPEYITMAEERIKENARIS